MNFMAETIINVLVEGGKASAGPPLGPALGQAGVNVGQVVAEINKSTKQFEGIRVPVKVIIDVSTKTFRVEIGKPPVSALILKEIKAQRGAKIKDEKVGNITLEQMKKIVEIKNDQIYGLDLKAKIKQIAGTCKSMGVTCEGMDPKEFIKKIDNGEIKL